jgi:ABC-type polysaccharide/polyol phosphate transport system ATPase subunit
MKVIVCEHVSKIFHRHSGGQRLLREHVSSWWKRRHQAEFYAVKDVSFEIADGESVALIGSNGAGKSTLLSLISGLAKPNAGKVTVNGKTAGLLELGAGFHPSLTGSENLYLNASLLGFTKRQTKAMFGPVVEFAGLAEVMDEPLRTYSSGMSLRLAFSIAINVNPDILMIDEILAVGDQAFQAKCLARMKEFRKSGRTMILVSHSLRTATEFCDRALWLDHGELVMQGNLEDVAAAYEERATVSQVV